jgi:Cu(I)/Ag(I) efflux system periplasmic protein CusF
VKRIALALIAALSLSSALADEAHHKTGALSDGEIRKVDKAGKKLTIKHGPLQNIDMPPMTMVFQVKDPKMLDQVKVGDKVKFEAGLLPGGKTVVNRLEVVK